MAEVYLDPIIIVVFTIIIMGLIAFFDYLPDEKRFPAMPTKPDE
jgi:hypothetical protein